jgi:hypothetical protein
MCLQAKKSFPEPNFELPLKLSSHVLDEIGKIVDNPLGISHGMTIVAAYFRGQIISYHDLCEDG